MSEEQIALDDLMLADGELFHDRKGAVCDWPRPLAPLADTHGHLTSFRAHDPAMALVRAALAGVRLLVVPVDPVSDIPRKWVASDEVVVEVCKRTPGSFDRLRRIRGTEQISERDGKRLLAAVARGVACPAEECPKVTKHLRPSPETEGVIDLMYAVLRLVSEKSGVATQLIATRDDLLDFLQDRERSALAGGWRWELAGRTLDRLLSGEVGLTVKSGRIELL